MKVVYGSKGCVKCTILVKELEEKGEDFEYVDIHDLSKEEMQEIAETSESLALPIVIER